MHQEANIFPNDDGLDVKRTVALAGDELRPIRTRAVAVRLRQYGGELNWLTSF